MPKKYHPHFGEVEVVTAGKVQSVVKLKSGENRTVTSAWLQDQPGPLKEEPTKDGPAANKG